MFACTFNAGERRGGPKEIAVAHCGEETKYPAAVGQYDDRLAALAHERKWPLPCTFKGGEQDVLQRDRSWRS